MVEENQSSLGIYIDLDSILDTRMGTLMVIDSDKAKELITSDSYYTRETEEFDGFDKAIFDRVYQSHDKRILENSTLSNMVFVLRDAVKDMFASLLEHPTYKDLTVYVNTYPYKLNQKEILDIQAAIHHYTDELANIKMIYKTLAEVDCLWVYKHVSHLFIYHYSDWLNLRAKELAHKGLPFTSLYSPRIYFERKPTEDEIKLICQELETNDFNHFDFLRDMAVSLIQINFMPIDHYCVVNDYYERHVASDDATVSEDSEDTSS